MNIKELASKLKESDFTIESVDAVWGTVTVDGYQKGEWSFELDPENPGYVMVYKNKFYSATYEEPPMRNHPWWTCCLSRKNQCLCL